MQSPVSSVAAIVPSLLVILSVPHMSSLQIDVENSNPDACTIANIIELFMGHQIETIKRSPQGIAVSLALFSYQEDNTATEKDLDVHVELLEELLHARVRKTLVVFREAMMLVDARHDHQLTKTCNPLLQFSYCKVQATILSHVWTYAKRRLLPRKDNQGNLKEPMHVRCNAVHRLKQVYRELEDQKAAATPGSPYLLDTVDEPVSPRVPEQQPEWLPEDQPAWAQGWSDSGERQIVTLEDESEAPDEHVSPQDAGEGEDGDGVQVNESLPDTVASTQPAAMDLAGDALAHFFAETVPMEGDLSAVFDDECVPPGQDTPLHDLDDFGPAIDVPSSQDTPAMDDFGSAQEGAPRFQAALDLCKSAMSIPAENLGMRKVQKKPAAKGAPCKKRPAAAMQVAQKKPAASGKTTETSPPDHSSHLSTPRKKRAKPAKTTPTKSLAPALDQPASQHEGCEKVAVAMAALSKLKLQGWSVESRVRLTGATRGMVDVYYKSPTGTVYRSMTAVGRVLAEHSTTQKAVDATDATSTNKHAGSAIGAAPACKVAANVTDWFGGDRTKTCVRFSKSPSARHCIICDKKQVLQLVLNNPADRAAHAVFCEHIKDVFIGGAQKKELQDMKDIFLATGRH